MAMQTTGSNTEGEPMMEINTTPLIDVMLVLLIMFIITIPPQTPRGEAGPAAEPDRTTAAADRPDQEQGRGHARRARCCGTGRRST